MGTNDSRIVTSAANSAVDSWADGKVLSVWSLKMQSQSNHELVSKSHLICYYLDYLAASC